MSNPNQNKPRLGTPNNPPASLAEKAAAALPVAPPMPQVVEQPSPLSAAKNVPARIRARHAELLEKFPLPWVVGPYGDVWVAADVEIFDPDTETSVEKIAGPDGTFWRATCPKPRLVFEPTDKGIAALTVDAVNLLSEISMKS